MPVTTTTRDLGLSIVAAVVALAGRAQAQGVPVLPLHEALRHARSEQPRLREATAERAAARGRAREAQASWLPQVTATAGYQRTTANFVARPGAVPNTLTQRRVKASSKTFDFFNFGLTASQLVYDFGQTGGRVRAASSLAHAQDAELRTASLATDLAVRQAYFAAQAARAMRVVAREALENQQHHLTQVQAFVQVGRRPEIDLAQVRTDVANARVNALRADSAYDLAWVRLDVARGVEQPVAYDVSEDVLPPLPDEHAPIATLLAAAIQARPELESLARQTEAQRHAVRAAQGGYGPALSVSSTLSDVGTKLDDLTWNWNAGVALNFPLFEGGATRAEGRTARATLEAVEARAEGARQQVRLEVEEARLAVVTAKAVIDAATEAVHAAGLRRELGAGRFEAGVGSVIELEDAELALTEARAQRVRADYDLSSARALLLRALGRAE